LSAPSQSDAAAAPRALSTTKLFFTIFPSIMLPMFLAVADQTIVATALPAIAGSLGGVEQISWVVISYLVAATIAAPVYGRFGDVFGRRRLMYIGLCIFMAPPCSAPWPRASRCFPSRACCKGSAEVA
jgi:MFS family permease